MPLPQYEYRRFCNMDDELNSKTVGDAIIRLERHVDKLYELLAELNARTPAPTANPKETP